MDYEIQSVFQDPSQFVIHSSQIQHHVNFTSDRVLSNKVSNERTSLQESFILFSNVTCLCNT